MAENVNHPVRIDLNEFKLHIHLNDKMALSLHFNSPSRKFYLSLIALVVMEMKKRGKIVLISLEEHLVLLALINDTVGGSAGSSERENLLPRIYRKWKHALPNLEEAPLFKILGRRKEDDGIEGRTYPFSDQEKDQWANLFAYIGSEENVRLKFDIEKIGLNLNDVAVTYGDLRDQEAWAGFISHLRGRGEKQETRPDIPVYEQAPFQAPQVEENKPRRPNRSRRAVLVVAVIVVLSLITLAVWHPWPKPAANRVASLAKMAYPLPDKPSIAVLPFENLSGDPQQEFFSDGITESILTALSKVPRLFVIARKSSFAYKGKPVTVKQVSEDLGVQYVLEGSVQKSGERVRITAQLIDALTGNHLWAERYDRRLQDIFAVQDEITMNILVSMRVNLTEGEQALRIKPPQNLEAFLKALQAQDNIQQLTREGITRGRQLAEEAVVLDPKFSGAYTLLCLGSFLDVSIGFTKSPEKAIAEAVTMAQKAISLDPGDSRPHAYLGFLFMMKKEYGAALTQGEKAVALDPGGADAHAWLGIILNYSDRPREAIPFFEKAIRLNPNGPAFYFHNFGHTYRFVGQYGEAAAQYQRALRVASNNILARLGLTATYSLMGRDAEARAEAEEVLRINPKFSLEAYARTVPHKNRAQLDRYLEALRQAGLK
jgi:TolB-like protein/Tfp pilus assembly protein PilF